MASNLSAGGVFSTNRVFPFRVDWHQALVDPQFAQSVAHIILPANEQNLDRLHAVLLGA